MSEIEDIGEIVEEEVSEMTDKERAEEYAKEKIKDMKVGNFELLEIAHLPNGADVYNPKVEHLLKDWIKQAYDDGTAEGRKESEEENAELKAENKKLNQTEWEDADTIAHMASTIAKLEKENAELEEIRSGQVRIINNDTVRIERLKKEIAELKAHCKAVDEVNEKMECCGNCKYEHCHGVCVSPEKCVDMNKWEMKND